MNVQYAVVITLFCFISISVACTHKTLPVITARKTEPVKPITKVVDIEPDLTTGKIIFANSCGRCHDLPKPEQYSAKRWEVILSRMIPRARITIDQSVHLTAYLKENAGK